MPSVDVAGSSIYYETVGAGTPLILFAGGFGGTHDGYRPLLDRLADEIMVVFHDYRGHGRSGPIDLDTTTIDTYADDAAALCRHLGLEGVVALGHSFGGDPAARLAARHPDLVRGLVLMSTSFDMDDEYWSAVDATAEAKGVAQPDASAAWRRVRAGASKPNEEVMGFLPLYFHRWPVPGGRPPDPPPVPTPPAVADLDQRLSRGAASDVLRQVACPTLLIFGESDFICPLDPVVKVIRDAVEKSELVVIPEAGHYLYAEQWDAFRASLMGWVRRLR